MAKNLLIVESPAKAKTIEGYLGKDFLVKSSYGHIRDLVKGDMGIDVDNDFSQTYEVPADKKQVVSELKKLAKGAETVWLASDEDREGEAISWHLFETLGLKKENTKRIVFHEITKPAILKAIETPRGIDYNLVYAQQARRVLDRLVGFELSPVLWKKVKPSLSAGRVQSVAVRLIVDREREVNKFNATAAFKITAQFTTGKGREIVKAELPQRFEKAEEAEKFLQDCVSANFKVNNLEVKPAKRNPAAPFTTSTLQQEASRKLGYSVARTMQIAQRLYENGKITYMRTDSVNLSETAVAAAAAEIKSAYGNQYHQPRVYKTKSAGAQEAHEAIRPTYFDRHTTDGDNAEKRLYELIWKRAIASQMSEAVFEKTTVDIGVSTRKETFGAEGEVLKFDGFLKVYLESTDDEDDENENNLLPPLTVGQELNLKEMLATERFSRPPARYTEASLVKKLEELGIGRPSTYAPTISTIQNRGYVVKEDRDGKKRDFLAFSLADGKISKQQKSEITGAEKAKLFPTDIGEVVNDFLVEHFKGIVDFNFTAKVEKQFDEIAQGLQEWTKMLHSFYKPFHTEVETTIETADRATGERLLGVDPATGKNVYTKVGRFGPLVQIGELSDNEEEKPRYASLTKTQSVGTITLEEALDLFKLPFQLEDYKGKEVSVGLGRFGPYVKWGDTFISIPKNVDPLTIDFDRAVVIIDEKIDADAPVAHYQNLPVTKGTGRFGPFIKWNDLFINVPKAYNFDNLSQNDINELISKKIEKENNRFIQQWPELKIAIENGRWGPFIRFGKDMLKLGNNPATKQKYTAEELASISLDEVKALIVAQKPDAFEAKKKAPAKKKTVAKKK